MKDSREYARKLRKFYRSLKRKYARPECPVYDDPIDAIIYGTISEKITCRAADAAMRRCQGYFVGLNDLRVSRTEEIVDVLGEDTPDTRDTALTLTRFLYSIFDRYNAVSLKTLKKAGKKPARQILEKLNVVTDFAIDYCMLTSLQAHAIPLTRRMIECLSSNDLVHPDADEQQIKGFLARQVSAEDAYQFYALLRTASEARRTRQRGKTAAKTKKQARKKTKKEAKKKK